MFRRRRPVRKWRLRGRRGQVSAVATILGLLLVVTFIANYLTATLPGQMSINDLNHVVQVEDQVGRLAALLQAASAVDAVGAQLTQPITLGSAGQPPFAQADPGTIAPATNGSSFNLTLPIGGSWSYSAPTIGTAGYKGFPSTSCTSSATQLTCTGSSTAYWNVSEASGTNLAFTGASGTYNVAIKDSGTNATKATITTTLNNVGTLNLLVLGSNVSIPFALSGQGTVNIEIVGNYDNLTITDTSGGGDVNLVEVGLHDTTWVPQAAGLNFLANIAGTSDYVRFSGTESALNANTVASVYFLGDTPTTTACPNDNLAASDFVEGGHNVVHTGGGFGGGHYTSYGQYNVTYNVTSTPVTLSTTPPAQWTEYNPLPEFNALVPEAAYCPLYVQASNPLSVSALGGGTIVHLSSTYIPSADVAFDQGAVVYAQQGGIPILIDPPGITATMSGTALSALSIWLPIFVGTIPIASGLSTAEFQSRLVSTNTITFTSGSATDIAANNNINVTIVSPFAAAWVGYFNATYPYDTFSYGCFGPSAACNGPYNTGGPLGTAWIDIATGALLSTVTVETAVFSVSLV